MKKFMLLIFADFESQEMCKELALSFVPLVDSPKMKFQHTKGNLLIHFASEVSQEEIYDYTIGILYGISSQFILTEVTDKLSLYLPKDVKDHLLDLENDTAEVDMKVNLNNLFEELDEEEDDGFVALVLEQIKNKVPKPSLDSILDKIKSKGFQSLTQFEKDTLEEYSKS